MVSNFRVIGTSKDSSAFADFEEALLAAPLFSEVYPLVGGGGPASGKGYRLQLVVSLSGFHGLAGWSS